MPKYTIEVLEHLDSADLVHRFCVARGTVEADEPNLAVRTVVLEPYDLGVKAAFVINELANGEGDLAELHPVEPEMLSWFSIGLKQGLKLAESLIVPSDIVGAILDQLPTHVDRMDDDQRRLVAWCKAVAAGNRF